jgi:hypothetical protein
MKAIIRIHIETLPAWAASICKRSGISKLVIIPGAPATRELGVEVIAIEALMVPVNTGSPY